MGSFLGEPGEDDRWMPVDFELEQRLCQQYLKDETSITLDLRESLDAAVGHSDIPKPNGDEAFRFFLDDEINT